MAIDGLEVKGFERSAAGRPEHYGTLLDVSFYLNFTGNSGVKGYRLFGAEYDFCCRHWNLRIR